MFTRIALTLAIALAGSAFAQDAKPAPIKALLLAGGCCHDYAAQKDILKQGIESRANVTVDVIYTEDTSTAPPLSIYGNASYADGYDIVIHDECAADINDPKVVEGVIAPHRNGTPAVVLHCGMHCYRTTKEVAKPQTPGTPESLWFDVLGLQSSGHGPQKPIAISFVDKAHPTVTGMEDWTTINEELYNNIVVRDDTHAIAKGVQEPNRKPGFTESVVVWSHEYGDKKTRVWATTLGHNNETVQDARYLDMVTRGVLWACNKIQDNGQPAEGYGK